MDLLGMVQTVIEISKSREEFGEEVKKMRIQLDTLCAYLKDLDDSILPKQLHEQIKNELEDSNQLLKKLPEKAGIIHAVTSKLPFMNSLQEVKDRSTQLQSLSQMLSNFLIGHMAIQQSHKYLLIYIIIFRLAANKQQVNIQQTQEDNIDQNNLLHHSGVQVIMKLVADEFVKNAFRSKLLNLCETQEIKFQLGINECDVHKFRRSYYNDLTSDIQQVQTISSEHAVIKCKRNPKEKEEEQQIKKDLDQFTIPSQKKQQQQQQQQQQELQQYPQSIDQDIFYTCIEEIVEERKQVDKQFEYTFYIENLGKMGIFLYRDEQNEKNGKEKIDQDFIDIPIGVWTRLQGKKKAWLHKKDKIGILMKKPDYKTSLIAYEFDYLL